MNKTTQRKKISEVSLLLIEAYPGKGGLGLKSVTRFCFKNGKRTKPPVK